MSESSEDESPVHPRPGGSQVTKEWMERVLTAHHQAPVRVLGLDTGPGSQAEDAVLSDILAVSVAYSQGQEEEEDGPAPTKLQLIVKLLPQDPFQRYFVTEAQFDLREVNFYTQIAPELHEFQAKHLVAGAEPIRLAIPKLYYASYGGYSDANGEGDGDGDGEQEDSVLVLEDLTTEGFAVSQFAQGLSLEQAEAALTAIAHLHGLTLALKVKGGRGLEERYPFLFGGWGASDSYGQLVERGLPQLTGFLERQPGEEGLVQALQALRPHTKHIIASLLAPTEPMGLITHTDFWCNNLLFRPGSAAHDPPQVRVLDWQMVGYSRPTTDVALLVVSSLGTEVRRAHTGRLLDTYYAALERTTAALGLDLAGGLGFTRPALTTQFRASQLLALLLCIGSVDLALGTPATEQRLLHLLHDLHEDGVLALDMAPLPPPPPAPPTTLPPNTP